ncbi:MAG TPA: polysaccharide biosynthesis C-terminal domain-containing protein, partial [Candidatus Acidoferrum sp.]
MNRQEKLTLLKNATANVVRGGAAALVALALPPFLVRLLSQDAFGVWSLVLQLSMFVGYLDFGIQTAVGRFVAHANAKGDSEYRDRITSTAFAALTAAGTLAIVGTIGIAALLPHIFKQMPGALIGDARVALLLVAGSLASGLPASVFNGIFVGIQRYELPAMVIGSSRLVSAFTVILVLRAGGGLVSMASAVALCNLASYLIQYLLYRRIVPEARTSIRLASTSAGRELFHYCFSLSIWALGMLLVTGLDLTLVGYFQFSAVAYYAVAASLVTFIGGLQNAVFNVMIPSTAVLQARGASQELGRVMVTATRYGTFLLLFTGLPLIISARYILNFWVGPVYSLHGARILQVLVAANIIRLSATPYAMTLIGTAQQRFATVTVIAEGVANLLASIIAGYLFGAIGVAFGTFIGSLVGIGGNFFYNMRRVTAIDFRISDYIRDGLLRPTACTMPLIVFAGMIT